MIEKERPDKCPEEDVKRYIPIENIILDENGNLQWSYSRMFKDATNFKEKVLIDKVVI